MKICVISANIGNFEKPVVHVPQSIDCDFYTVDDSWYPLRHASMTSRLQARIVKTHIWEFVPDYDYYLWIDSSCRLSHENSVKWFLQQLVGKDIAVFKHPHRNTVREEADYLEERLILEKTGKKRKYILPRYENEDIDGQLKALQKDIKPNRELFASTAFICRPTMRIKEAFKEWWYQISRYHSIDQLSFPYAIRYCDIGVINENYLKCKYIEPVRK